MTEAALMEVLKDVQPGKKAKEIEEMIQLVRNRPIHMYASNGSQTPKKKGPSTTESGKSRVMEDVRPLPGRRKARLDALKDSRVKFTDLEPLHDLWQQYMTELLRGAGDAAAIESFLLRADLHGCELRIVEARNPCLIGVSGIVAIESMHMFVLVGRDNIQRRVQKSGCVFEFYLRARASTVRLLGSSIAVRPAERAARKFKSTM